MKNLSIGKKLGVTFGIVLVLYLISLLCAIFLGVRTVSNTFEEFYDGPYQVTNTSSDLRRSLNKLEKSLLNMMAASDAEDLSAHEDEMNEAIQEMSADVTFLQENLTLEENKQRLATMVANQSTSSETRKEIVQYIKDGNITAAQELYESDYAPMTQTARDLAKEISVSAQAVGDTEYAEAKAAETRTTWIVIVYFIVTMGIIVLLGAYLVRSITKPLHEIESAAKLMADGKLDAKVTYSSKDEIGSLANSIRTLIASLQSYIHDISRVLGRMSSGDMTVSVDIEYYNDFAPIKHSMEQIIQSLNNTLAQISIASQQVTAGAEQMSAGAQYLSEGATEQASSTEELAASISEIADRVKTSADSAQQAKNHMDQTAEEIQQGNEQMKNLVGAMAEIAGTSGEIQKITKMINEITSQINILSLNASIEAARAGAAGKGFSVVADEVRSLAGKSGEAAKNITDLIQNTMFAIENGDKLVVKAEQSLDRIAQSANTAGGLVREIAETSEAQAGSIGQINAGVSQISSVIQTNSATAEESAASSEELSAQAEMLQSLVSQFQLKGDSFAETVIKEDLEEEKYMNE